VAKENAGKDDQGKFIPCMGQIKIHVLRLARAS
jgi:hypothetical protein